MKLSSAYLGSGADCQMPWLVREHPIPDIPLHIARRKIRNRYVAALSDGQVLTSYDVDTWMQKKYGDFTDRTINVSLQLTETQMEDAIVAESLDRYYEDIKPGDKKKLARAKRFITATPCPICLYGGLQFQVHPCKCHFHRKCVEEALRWSPKCPTCGETINATEAVSKCNGSAKRRRITRKS